MTDQLDVKKEQAAKLWREIRDEEDRRKREEEYPEKKKLEGYRKFRNSYGGGLPSWWLHVRVSNVTKDGYVDLLKLQIDANGRLSIEEQKGMPWELLGREYIESSEGEWHEAWLQAEAIMKKAKA